MCGIVGRFERRAPSPDPGPLVAATNLLAHRGPDDGAWWADGPFFLGHRRLSVIDLQGGQQPMASQDGRYVVAFNGEIYNYVELRETLLSVGRRFRTESDTEVLLEGYATWGTNLPRHLVGMFAFAIVDRRAGTVFLARDRFGEKPLFVHETKQAVTFASEIRALASMRDVETSIDDEALAAYLCLNYVPGERTMLQSVKRLPPASWCLYSTESSSQGAYWAPPARQSAPGSMEDVLEVLRGRLDESVRLTLRSDVPVALFLSGGLDSSIVAESAARQGRLRDAYCLVFPDARFSELDKAAAVAERLGLGLRTVELGPAALEHFLTVVEHADDPLADSSALAVWTLAREAARDYKVVISGDGGDELFGGYLTYAATALHGRLERVVPHSMRTVLARTARHLPVSASKVSLSYRLMRFLRALDLSPAVAHFTWNGTWLPADAARLAASPEAAGLSAGGLERLVASLGLPSRPTLFELQRADVREYLCNDILVKVDRMTMANGLEARAPLLTPGVAEFALALPDRYKLGPGGQTKRVLRALSSRIYGPAIARAKKQGFSIPVHDWLRGPARSLVTDLLSPTAVAATGLLVPEAVTAGVARHLSGRAQLGFELWGLMVLVAWWRARVRQRPGSSDRRGLRRMVIDARLPQSAP